MDIRYKLFPYPVLAYYSDDYRNSAFDTTIDISREGYNLCFHFMSSLKNPQLMQLVKEGKAQFVYHLECAQTGYRKVISTSKKEETRIISNKDVCGKMQICPFIVAVEDITGYSNDFFHEDYAGVTFDIEAGCVMALGKQVNVMIEKEMDDLANVPSIFAIIFNADPNETHMVTDIDGSRIIIKLPSDDYTNYKALNQNALYQPLLVSLVIIPALVYALDEIKTRPCTERYEYEERGWYRTIRKTLQSKFSCDIESEAFNSKNSLELAQKLIDEPLHDALRVLANSSGTGEEEDA